MKQKKNNSLVSRNVGFDVDIINNWVKESFPWEINHVCSWILNSYKFVFLTTTNLFAQREWRLSRRTTKEVWCIISCKYLWPSNCERTNVMLNKIKYEKDWKLENVHVNSNSVYHSKYVIMKTSKTNKRYLIICI